MSNCLWVYGRGTGYPKGEGVQYQVGSAPKIAPISHLTPDYGAQFTQETHSHSLPQNAAEGKIMANKIFYITTHFQDTHLSILLCFMKDFFKKPFSSFFLAFSFNNGIFLSIGILSWFVFKDILFKVLPLCIPSL